VRERPNSSIDPWVLFVVVTLTMVGLTAVYAATYHLGISHLKWHFVRAAIGLVVLLLGIKLCHRRFAGKARHVVLVGTLLLLAATLVVGIVVSGARRWLGPFQPAELAKFALPVWLAAYFANLKSESTKDWNFKNTVAKPGAVVFVFLVLLLLQPAISTTIILAVATMVLFFVVGVRLRYLVPIALIAGLLVFAAIRLNPYARNRVSCWMEGSRYQQKQSLIAVGSGGPFGKGLGEGKQKLYFLPELHTDFIAAAIGEEFGFVGSVGIFGLFGVFLVGGMLIGLRANSYFGQFLASGIVITIFMYALIHMAVALGLTPPTGQPLPFVSFGGSALVSNLFAAGVLLNISRYRRRPDERADSRRWNRRSRVSRAGARG